MILPNQSQRAGCRVGYVSTGNKKLILLLLVLWLPGCDRIVDWVAVPLLLPQEGVRPATFTADTIHRIEMVTRDGVTLLADVHRPVGVEKVPTILVRIPQTRTLVNQLRADAIGRYWASRGYAVVIQGTRGRYGSGGTFYPLIHERQDGIDTLQWLAKQEWYDGRVAMWGGSSFGHTQWAVSDQINPGPSALFVHIVSTDFRRMFYQGNAFALESALYWAVRSRGEEDRDVSVQQLDEGERTLPLSQADDRAIGDTEFYNDWLKNQHNSAYWERIDGVDRASTVQSPVLLLGGWYDPFLPGQLADFIRIRAAAMPAVSSKTHLVIGPWVHADSVKVPGMKEEVPYRQSTLALSLPWFDAHLGIGATSLQWPRVRLFVMGENVWRDENEWPLARTQYTPLYFHSAGHANSAQGDGRLEALPPIQEEPSDTYTYDPVNPVVTRGGAMLGDRAGILRQNEIESRQDVLVYTTSTLTELVEVTGPLRAVLYVRTDAPSTDFTVKLVDVHPDGIAYNVSDGILRRGYRPSTKSQLSSPDEIEVELGPTSQVFLPGHRIRVEVSSSNFPRFDRNLNTGDDPSLAIKPQVAHQVIFHQAAHPSHIVLPIIPR